MDWATGRWKRGENGDKVWLGRITCLAGTTLGLLRVVMIVRGALGGVAWTSGSITTALHEIR